MAVFTQSAGEQIFTAPVKGLYRIDAYGEQGGRTGRYGVGYGAHGYNATGYYELGQPGKGGKVTGYVILKKGESVILQVAKNLISTEYVWTNVNADGKYYAATACRGGRRVVAMVNGNTLLIAPGGGGTGGSGGEMVVNWLNGGAGGMTGGNGQSVSEINPASGAAQTFAGTDGGAGYKDWGTNTFEYAPAAEGYYNGGRGAVLKSSVSYRNRFFSCGGGASAYVSPMATVTLEGQTYSAECVTGGNGQAYAWAEIKLLKEIKSNIKSGDKDVKIMIGGKTVTSVKLGNQNIY